MRKLQIARRLALITAGAACGAGLLLGITRIANAQEASVTARDAWTPVIAKSKTETAVYVVLENHTAVRRAIVGGSSEQAAKVELHQMSMEKSMMRMTPVSEIGVPPKGKTDLRPGTGFHVMVFGLKKPLMLGDSLALTLKIDDGSTVPVTATVRK